MMLAVDERLHWSVRKIAEGVRSRETSAIEMVELYLTQIEQSESKIRAYRSYLPELARKQAIDVDQAIRRGETIGPLSGVPMALKDNFVTRGILSSCGSKMLEDWSPPYDGTQYQRLRNSGAILLGKNAMDEFAMGSSNENTPYAVVRNPWCLDRVPGGSSGGCAASVAAYSSAFALGSDTGGSVRQPASMCGVVGFKPSYGRISRYGMIAFASSFEQPGLLTRSVRDAAYILPCLAGYDEHDATSCRSPIEDYLGACEQGLSGRIIGVHRQALSVDGLDSQVRQCFETALSVLQQAGAKVIDIELPHFSYAVATYYVLTTAEASSNLARYDGIRYGFSQRESDLLTSYQSTRAQGFGEEVKRRIMLGTFVLRADSYEKYVGQAMKVRTLIAQDYAEAFKKCDVIASPVSPVPAFPIGERSDNPLAMYLSDVFTTGANLAGLPGISVPSGFAEVREGANNVRLPVGLQLLAPKMSESKLLAVASAYEDASEWKTFHCPKVCS